MKIPFKKNNMNLPFLDKEKEALPTNWLNNLVELASKGHYPLFYQEWLTEYSQTNQKSKLNAKDRKSIMRLKSKLAEHKSLERKKIILSSFKKEDRDLFIRHFFGLVETHLLDKRPELH